MRSVRGEGRWPFNTVTALVDGELVRPKQHDDGGQEIRTRCPVHGSDHPDSLTIREYPSGAVKLLCASCQQADLAEYYGLTLADLARGPDGEGLTNGSGQDDKRGTDIANAELLAAKYASSLRYTDAVGWLQWTGKTWEPSDGAVVTAIRNLAEFQYISAIAEPDQDRAARLKKNAAAMESASRVFGLAKIAQAHPQFYTQMSAFDADPWLLGTPNGVVDLRTGELRPHKAGDLISKHTAIEYVPDARAAAWDDFLGEATAGKEGLEPFLRRAAGYTLTGTTLEEALFLVHGPASAGKSTFVEALRAALGDYGGGVPFEALTSDSHTGGHNEPIARLVGKRMVVASEGSRHQRLKEGLIKSLTGGDIVSASFKSRRVFEYTPIFKLWLSTNHVPHAESDDSGLWRRVKKVPFENVPKVLNPRRKYELMQEPHNLRAILAWAVRGCLEWQREGLNPPACVTRATAALRRDMDPLADFFDACCVFGPDYSATNAALRNEYEAWSDEIGLAARYRVSPKRMAQGLQERGCVQRRQSQRAWCGVRLRTDDDPDSQEASPTSDTYDTFDSSSQVIPIEEDIGSNRESAVKSVVTVGVSLIADPPAALAVARECIAAGTVGVDTETRGLDPHADMPRVLRTVQLATEQSVYVVDCDRAGVDWLAPLLAETRRLVFQNAAFDLQMFMGAGLRLPRDIGGRLFDTMLAAQLLNGGAPHGGNSLAALAERYLGVTLDKAERLSDWSQELTPEQVAYAAKDAEVLLPLMRKLEAGLEAEGLTQAATIEFYALPAFASMQFNGFPIDVSRMAAAVDTAKAEAAEVEAKLEAEAGRAINWKSPKQVLTLLHERGHNVAKTDDRTLAELAERDNLARLLQDFRGAVKRVGMYSGKFAKRVHPVTGRIHPNLRQIGAATGRVSCAEPNLQQVPRAPEYRACFRVPEGRAMVKADYSQIELRVAALLAGEDKMLAAFESGADLHQITADAVGVSRQIAKSLNFGLLYGMGVARLQSYILATTGTHLTEDEAAAIRGRFFRAFPKLRRWHQVAGNGPSDVRSLTGRLRRGVERFTDKLNTPVQASAADGLKVALATLYEAGYGPQMILTVHDEIVFEVPTEESETVTKQATRLMVESMATVLGGGVKVEVEAKAGESWNV